MKRLIALMLLMFTVAGVSLSVGCADDDDASSDAGTDTDADADTDTDTDADTDTDTGTEGVLLLDDSHQPSWGVSPKCRSTTCHPDSHHSDLSISGCVPCHGTNGAQVEDHQNCNLPGAGQDPCHGDFHGDAAEGFPPGTCGPCHS